MRLLFLVLFFITLQVSGQTYDNVIGLQIFAVTGEILDQKVSIQLEFKNAADSTILLYGMKSVRNVPIEPEHLCDHIDKMLAGMALYVYDMSMKKIGTNAPLISEEFDYKPMAPEFVDSPPR